MTPAPSRRPQPQPPPREHRDEARIPHRPVPGDAAHGGRRLGGRVRLRGPRDRLLAALVSGPTRRYAGTSHIDVANLSDGQATEIVDEIAAKGLSISGLGFYPNPLHPDPAHREQVIGHLKAVMVAARKMGVPLVNTFMGGDGAKNQDQNWEEALRVWPDIVAFAQDQGVKITLENCPMLFSLRRVAGRPQHRHHARGCGAGSWSSGATRSG